MIVPHLFIASHLFSLLINVAMILAIIAIIRAMAGGGGRRRRWHRDLSSDPEDQAQMQRLMQGLDRMERRIDNLETILSPSRDPK